MKGDVPILLYLFTSCIIFFLSILCSVSRRVLFPKVPKSLYLHYMVIVHESSCNIPPPHCAMVTLHVSSEQVTRRVLAYQ